MPRTTEAAAAAETARFILLSFMAMTLPVSARRKSETCRDKSIPRANRRTLL